MCACVAVRFGTHVRAKAALHDGPQAQDRNGNASGADVATCIRERRHDLHQRKNPHYRPFRAKRLKRGPQVQLHFTTDRELVSD